MFFNIAVKHGLELVDHKVVVMLKKIRKSTLLTDELKKIFESKDEKFLSPIWDNSTRWNSTYLMIYRQQKTKDFHQRLVRTSEVNLNYPNNNKWTKLNNLCEVLKPIYVATTLLSNT